MSEETRIAAAREDLGLVESEIRGAACSGIDMIWGYADNQNAEQCSQIELAEANIIEAILLANQGVRLPRVEGFPA